MKYWVAIDIGASGGRHILGHIDKGRLITEEVYRFPNGLKEHGEWTSFYLTKKERE